MAHHNDLIGHNTSPDRNKPNPSPNRPHAAEPTRKALVTRESRLSKSESWDAETTKQAAEETFQLVTGGELDYEKRRDAAVELTGEAIKKFGDDEFEDGDVDVATEVIKQTLSGDLDSDSVSDFLNLK